MSRHKPIQIHIPQPCHEDWAKMTPQQKGRFCDSCQKCVVDFTNFSDTELYTFLQEHKDQKVCGRFKSTQLNRAINLPPQPHSTLYKWIVAAGLALVISTLPNSHAFAQAPVQQEQLVDWNDKDKQGDTISISGIVYDEKGEPIPSTIAVLKAGSKTIYGAAADTNGRFVMMFDRSIINIDSLHSIEIASLGYHNSIIPIDNNKLISQRKITIDEKLKINKEAFTPLMGAIGYDVPITDKETGTNKTFSGEDFDRMAH